MYLVVLQETKELGELVMEMEDYIFTNSGDNRLMDTGFLIRG